MKRMILLIPILLIISACVSKSEFEAAQSEISSLQMQIDDKETELVKKGELITETENRLKAIQSDYDALQETYSSLESDYKEQEDDYRNTKNEVEHLTSEIGKYICDQQISEMKYENILDVSTILAGWWARQPGVERVQGTYRDTIWSNADTKIHAIRFISSEDHQPYVEHFLVYYEEF